MNRLNFRQFRWSNGHPARRKLPGMPGLIQQRKGPPDIERLAPQIPTCHQETRTHSGREPSSSRPFRCGRRAGIITHLNSRGDGRWTIASNSSSRITRRDRVDVEAEPAASLESPVRRQHRPQHRIHAQVSTCRALAPVAQLDSASVFGTEGYRFESCRAYSKSLLSNDLRFHLVGALYLI